MEIICVLIWAEAPPLGAIISENPLWLIIIIFACLFAFNFLVGKFETRKLRGFASGKYKLADSVLTKTELKFYHVLVEAVPDKHLILIKPRLADFIRTKTKRDQAAFNRIRAKHVDFLLCDKRTLAPLLAIELDDASHNHPRAKKRDTFVNALYSDIRLPIWRLKVADSYEQNFLLSEINSKLGINPPPLPTDAL